MGVETKLQPSNPPKPLVDRWACLQLNSLNTIVIPHDPKDEAANRWACTTNDPENLPVPKQRKGNEVVYFVDAKEAYPQFQCEMEKTGGEGDFIYMLGWDMHVDLVFPDVTLPDGTLGQKGRSLRDLFTEHATKGVKIRVMLDGQIHNLTDNEAVVRWLNAELSQYGAARSKTMRVLQPDDLSESLKADSRAAGIVDDRFPYRGSHHQKILLVRQSGKLTAFCGGMDVNPNRVQGVEPGDPQHDVHCRIRGPAAWDLLKIFYDRWNDYVRGNYPHSEKMVLTNAPPEPAPCGPYTVQICRTSGHLRFADGSTHSYEFAPKGERAIRELLKRAIRASQRFIYIEDQYLVNLEVAHLLGDHLSQIKHLTILVPPASLAGPSAIVDKRKEFIDILQKKDSQKVRVFCLNKKSATCGTYVHAKTWVFDDKFAIIGSANCDRRGMTYDSEVVAGIFDPSSNNKLTYTLAHRLRIKLWAHHLGLDYPEGHAELSDGVASGDGWITAPYVGSADSRVEAYLPDAPGFWGTGERLTEDMGWEGLIDPLGE
jgi:phosphatidylserine/phosphatidylglycerophosphate/cardiolipin synthase-like enzyme